MCKRQHCDTLRSADLCTSWGWRAPRDAGQTTSETEISKVHCDDCAVRQHADQGGPGQQAIPKAIRAMPPTRATNIATPGRNDIPPEQPPVRVSRPTSKVSSSGNMLGVVCSSVFLATSLPSTQAISTRGGKGFKGFRPTYLSLPPGTHQIGGKATDKLSSFCL